ncbi:MAG: hypothetical protein JWP87_4081 [Labilithrix sp.]|nr:hypothetical protein [Labilithrix sp.]
MKAHLVAAAAALVVLVVPALASAQEKSWFQRGLPAPSEALELSVGTGYTQGFGSLRSGVGMPQVAREGIAVDLSAGYRINPHWAISIGGQYTELNALNADAARGGTATLAAQYHIAPTTRLDPWLELGSGYRLLAQLAPTTGGNATTDIVYNHGFQLGRARAGIDLRLSQDIAIAPVIGADATMFVWQDVGGANTAIASPAMSTFVFAGVQGRVDVGGTNVGTTTVTSTDLE